METNKQKESDKTRAMLQTVEAECVYGAGMLIWLVKTSLRLERMPDIQKQLFEAIHGDRYQALKDAGRLEDLAPIHDALMRVIEKKNEDAKLLLEQRTNLRGMLKLQLDEERDAAMKEFGEDHDDKNGDPAGGLIS